MVDALEERQLTNRKLCESLLAVSLLERHLMDAKTQRSTIAGHSLEDEIEGDRAYDAFKVFLRVHTTAGMDGWTPTELRNLHGAHTG